jgi:hypothetical protein
MYLGLLQTRSRFRAFGAILGLAFSLSFCQVEAACEDQPLIFRAGHGTAYAEGKFSKGAHEVYFSFHARAGQHVLVKIKPLTRNLITAGVVIYPSGKQDGGPGGLVFDSDLTETGKYRIRITQRQVEMNGRFRLLVKISPQAKDGARGGNRTSERESDHLLAAIRQQASAAR